MEERLARLARLAVGRRSASRERLSGCAAAGPSWRYGLSGEKEGESWARGERGKEDWAGRVGAAQGKRGSAQGKKRASGPSGRGGPVLLGWKLGSWAGFGFPSSFSNKLKPHSNLIEFKSNLNSNPMHSTN